MAMRLREELSATARNRDTPTLDRAVVIAARGDPNTAWQLIQRTVDRESEKSKPDPRVLLAAGEIKLAQGDPREARRYYASILRRDPKNAEAQLGLGRVLAEQNDLAGASEALERAAEFSPDDPAAPILLAEITDDPATEARWLLRAAFRSSARLDADRASRLIDRAELADSSLSSDSWLAKGNLNTMLGLPAQSLVACRYARSAGAGETNPEVHSGTGRAYLALGDSTRAAPSFERALELGGDEVESLLELGTIYDESGRSDDALPLLASALQMSHGREDIRRTLARTLRNVGDNRRALEILKKGERRSPESLRELAKIHRSLDNFEAARTTLEGAIRLEPQNPRLRSDLAIVLEAQSDPTGAARQRGVATLLTAGTGDASGAGHRQRDQMAFRSLARTFSS